MAELLQFINNSIILNQSSEQESEKNSNYVSVCLKDCSYSIKFQNLWRRHFKASFGSINLTVLPGKRSYLIIFWANSMATSYISIACNSLISLSTDNCQKIVLV